jgi:hypothetical protein
VQWLWGCGGRVTIRIELIEIALNIGLLADRRGMNRPALAFVLSSAHPSSAEVSCRRAFVSTFV